MAFTKVNYPLYVIFIVLSFCISACKIENEIPNDEILGYNYFPMDVGVYAEYEVQETRYTLTDAPEVSDYQIREVITGSFTDIEGLQAFTVERSRRENTNDIWELDSIWVAKRKINQQLRIENNQIFVKLVFPPSKGLTWNGNSFNAFGEDTYEITEYGKPYQINGLSFENALRVEQEEDSNLVSLDRRYEIYAPDAGLVYKEIRNLNYCTLDNCIGDGKIDFGRILIQKIITYGKNN